MAETREGCRSWHDFLTPDEAARVAALEAIMANARAHADELRIIRNRCIMRRWKERHRQAEGAR